MRKATVGGRTVYVIGKDEAVRCQLCGAQAVVALTPEQIREQPDDTTHVCHPGLGGCNHGFAVVASPDGWRRIAGHSTAHWFVPGATRSYCGMVERGGAPSNAPHCKRCEKSIEVDGRRS